MSFRGCSVVVSSAAVSVTASASASASATVLFRTCVQLLDVELTTGPERRSDNERNENFVWPLLNDT